ncbi:MAG TPA: acylphosphatase [Verrucomicrobiae bacterium]|nr:acylphosphatase [Verrucomicrobiae bacterium]
MEQASAGGGIGRVRRHVVVRGRVQMVGFRLFVARVAAEHAVSGWVRNTPDGGVEAVVEGELAAVQQVVQRIAEGPAASRVTGIEHRELPIDVPLTRFRVEE